MLDRAGPHRVLALVLRWAFGRNQSLVERRPRRGRADEYGALVGLTTALFDSEAMAQKAFAGLHKLMTKEAEKLGHETIPITVRVGTTS